jgi:hypothetical protein
MRRSQSGASFCTVPSLRTRIVCPPEFTQRLPRLLLLEPPPPDGRLDREVRPELPEPLDPPLARPPLDRPPLDRPPLLDPLPLERPLLLDPPLERPLAFAVLSVVRAGAT